MSKQFEHNGVKYWVTVEPAIHNVTKETGFIAYVSDKKPDAFIYGVTLKDGEGKTIFFKDELTAITNANAVKQSEIGN